MTTGGMSYLKVDLNNLGSESSDLGVYITWDESLFFLTNV